MKIQEARKVIAIAAIALLMSPASHAGLATPYTPDADTLHLWHFDETSDTNCFDVATNAAVPQMTLTIAPGKTNEPFGAPTQVGLLGQPAAFPILGSSIMTTQFSCFLSPFLSQTASGPVTNLTGAATSTTVTPIYTNLSYFVNTNTGAFTFETLIYPTVNPITQAGAMELVCGDSGLTKRSWQFRITGGQLEYNDISSANSDFKKSLPTTGLDAATSNQWYHVALTFTGTAPTNGDSSNVLTMYWTLLDQTRSNCTVLGTFNKTNNPTGMTFLAVGGSGRGSPYNNAGNSEGFYGYFDEIRISDLCRKSNEMAFNSGVVLIAPTVTLQPPTNTLVGYGQTLTLPASISATAPVNIVWKENGTIIPGQTNATLVLSNVTFAANGNFQCFATNAIGSSNTTVAAVTVGAAFDGLFNTGTDNNGNLLNVTAPGSVDQHYQLIQSPDPASTIPNAIIWGNQGPVSPNGGYAANGPASVWIGPEENAGAVSGPYEYQTYFLVDEGDVASASLSGTVYAADLAAGGTVQIFVNNVETDVVIPGNPLTTGAAFTVTTTNGLQAGSNTVVFEMDGTAGASTAIRAEMIGIGQALPPGLPTINNQPDNQTIVFGSNATFSVVGLGRPPLSYQWLTNGVPANPVSFPGATNRTLTLSSANGDLPGLQTPTNYQVVISNASGSVTSSVATLTINDSIPLVVNSAGIPIWLSTNSQTQVEVVFSKSVDPATATTVANYSLNNGATVLSAALNGSSNIVTLTTSALTPGTAYTLTVQNVQDLFANPIVTQMIAIGLYPANIALWVKADTGVTADVNGLVSQWNDLSGNGNNLTQSSGAPLEPLLVSNALNGYPAVQFTASNGTYMSAADSSTLGITGDMTIFAAVEIIGPIAVTNGMIVSKTTSNKPSPYDYYANSTTVPFLRGNAAAFGGVNATTTISSNVPHVLDVMMQGTAVTHRLDGAANGGGTLATTIADDTAQPLLIGEREDGTNRLNGNLAELIIIGSSLSVSDRASIETYLTAKYVVSLVPPRIAFSAAGGQLTLSWPAANIGWQLQAQTNTGHVGINANWVNVPGSTTTDQVIIPFNSSNGSVFYRLIYP